MRDDAIEELLSRQLPPDGPGVAVAVVRGGQVIHRAGYGLASRQWSVPADPDAVFGLGSLTKPFTALAVLRLVAEGRLDLEQSITACLPEYPATGREVTMAHLLTHTSGIPNYITRLPDFWARHAPLHHSPAEIRALFADRALEFTPGSRYSYSNSGYCLLGMIVEAVTGMRYEVYVESTILEPLGMRNARYFDNTRIIPRLAGAYTRDDSGTYGLPPRVSPTLLYAAGGLAASVDDLIIWDQALCERRILPPDLHERMWSPVRLIDGREEGYGFGWGLSSYRGRRVVHHAGGIPGYSSFYGRFVEDDLALIILTNLGLFDAAELAKQITNLVLDLEAPAREPVSLPRAALAHMVGRFSNAVGEALEVVRSGDSLALRGEMAHELMPVSETVFRATDDPDVEVHFEDLGPAGYARVKVIVPFYWFVVYRQHG
jgi:CubicO group peptidase (beta-lactamase class C family)